MSADTLNTEALAKALDPRFKPNSKMNTDPNGCDDCGLNYCYCADDPFVAAVAALSPAPEEGRND